MSEEIKKDLPKEEPKLPEGPKVVIEVFMTPDGMLQLKSNMPPAMVVYALESIKFNILNQIEKQAQPMIMKPPAGGIVNFARQHFNKKGK